MEDNGARSILIDSVYAPLEQPKYSLRGSLIMLLVFNVFSILVAITWNSLFAVFWLTQQFATYTLISVVHFGVIVVTVCAGGFMAVALAKASTKLLSLQIIAVIMNWVSSAACAIAGTTFIGAGRMECVKWAKFRYFTAQDSDAWRFKTVGCREGYFITLAAVNWTALAVHSAALYSLSEYKDSKEKCPEPKTTRRIRVPREDDTLNCESPFEDDSPHL